jgi:hypothetical protein
MDDIDQKNQQGVLNLDDIELKISKFKEDFDQQQLDGLKNSANPHKPLKIKPK